MIGPHSSEDAEAFQRPTDSTHECPRTGCTRRVAPHMLACRSHWYMVPRPLRDAVWHTYKNDGQGSEPHRAAILAAVEAMNRA